MRKLIIMLSIGFIVLSACSNKKTVPADIEKFAGVWDMKILELPKVGDKEMATYLNPKDSLMTGYFIEDNGGRTEFSEITIEGNDMKIKYNWGGHDVSLKVEMSETSRDTFEGRMMGFFKVEGVRRKE